MARSPRSARPDTFYHVLNRGNDRKTLFSKSHDYEEFINLLSDAVNRFQVDLHAYCLMPNHFHLVLYNQEAEAMGQMMHWISTVHAARMRKETNSVGTGHIYQGRYKAFPIETDGYLLKVCRYVERNALTAKLTLKAEDWKYSSLFQRVKKGKRPKLANLLFDVENEWVDIVNARLTEAEKDSFRAAIIKGS